MNTDSADKNQDAHELYISYSGPSLLETPLLNKGSAFSEIERENFNLMGLLPPRYETIEEQADRAYTQYSSIIEPINKHIYLRSIQDNNETLFYFLVKKHVEEMMPIIYTPVVGQACERFSEIYRSSRGLFISYEQRNSIDKILHNAIKRNVKIIVVTDGERILGLGDQGIGGMGIPIGKLSLYTACAGISPANTLPITLDVGTNNQALLNDPMYMGLKQSRIKDKEYYEFVEMFMQAVYRRWPKVLVQFEDFAQQNAMPLLQKYRYKRTCFNDDIQGTAAVALGTVLAACTKTNTKLFDHNIVFVGAGSAGCGIAELFVKQLVREGLPETRARQHIFMVGRYGLLTEKTPVLKDFQKALSHDKDSYSSWTFEGKFPSLLDVVRSTKASILIGVSGQKGLFTEEVVREIARHSSKPIIFPLSNPSDHTEAIPSDIIKWTNGNAIVATGSPFPDVMFDQTRIKVTQCNNSYIFPGLGLGIIVSGANSVTDKMLMIASDTLANASDFLNIEESHLLPSLKDLPRLSKEIAFYVAKVAMMEGNALQMADDDLRLKIENIFWEPNYRSYIRTSN